MSIDLVSGRLRADLLIGAGGVLVRRNPLVILLCLELMLNAANLALVAFARTHGNQDGQIFALIVMVVAACEVAVGLGLIVAHLPPPAADRRRRAAGAAGMSLDTYGWLVPGCFPLARLPAHRASPPRCCPSRVHGVIGTLAIALSFVAAVRAFIELQDRPRGRAPGRLGRLGLREGGRRRRAAVDPDRPAVGPDDAGRLRRLDADPPLLGRLHGVDRGYTRFFAYLNFFVFSMLLLVLAANFFC